MRYLINNFTKLALLLSLAMLPQLASAHDFEVGGIYYNINGNEATVTYRGSSYIAYSNEYTGAVNIPSSVTYNGTTYSVTTIVDHAFAGCSGLTSVTIPNSVTSIGNRAFDGCSGLTSATIPNSVTEIGYGAFSGCSGLTSATIPNSVTEIGYGAFSGCSGLTSVSVESGNIKYDSRDNCNAIIETASNTLMFGCKNTIIPNSVTSIGDYAFCGCTGLTSATIPNSVTSIGDDAFSGCTSLTSVTIGNSVTSIGDNAFSGCSGLTSATIPNSVTEIGYGAFYSCTGLTSLTIPNSVTNIDYGAFSGCSSLTKLAIGASYFSGDAFDGCNVEELIVDSDGAMYYIFDEEHCLFKDSLKKLVIGNYVSHLYNNYKFNNYTNLTSITIGNRIQTIQYGVFMYCSNLESVIIGNSVTVIGEFAFHDCHNLRSLTIPSSVTSIQNYAFDGCYFLDNITIIGNGTFDIGRPFGKCFGYNSSDTWYVDTLRIGSEISSLGNLQLNPTNVYCYSNTPPTCQANTFTNYNGFLHVPSSAAAAYFMADYWQNFNGFNYDITEMVTLNQTEASLIQWDNLELTATVTPNDSELQWFSTNPDVATVDENGVVTAGAAGECDIYATMISNIAVYGSCHIIVDYPEITLSLSEESLEMNLGDEQALIAIITPENTNLNPTWTSSDESVAVVNNGIVTAIGEGECNITATVLDKTATCHVTVSGNVTITLSIESALIGANQMLTVYPSCSPDVPVELVVTSSDPSIAVARVVNRTNAPAVGLKSFTEKGMALNLMDELAAPSESKDPALASEKAIMIVGVQNGTATITVTTADGKATPAVLELRVVDVDGDRVITSSDITQLYSYLLSSDETYAATSDVNGDGNITAADITVLYNLLLGN